MTEEHRTEEGSVSIDVGGQSATNRCRPVATRECPRATHLSIDRDPRHITVGRVEVERAASIRGQDLLALGANGALLDGVPAHFAGLCAALSSRERVARLLHANNEGEPLLLIGVERLRAPLDRVGMALFVTVLTRDHAVLLCSGRRRSRRAVGTYHIDRR